MARLVYTDHNNQQRTVRFGPDQPVVSIGRATDCTIRSNRKSVSRHHAEFRYQGGSFEIVDLNSSNGTWLIEGDQRLPVSPRERLQDQDEIWCGDFVLHFFVEEVAGQFEPDADTVNRHALDAEHAGFESGFGAEPSEVFGEQPSSGIDTGQPVQPQYTFQEPEPFDDGIEPYDSEAYEDSPGFRGGQGGAVGFGGQQSGGEDYEVLDIEDLEVEEYDDADELVRRLEEEKASLEDLASRQAYDLEELQSRLRDMEAEVEALRQSGGGADELASKLEHLQTEHHMLQADLQEAEERAKAAEQRLKEADFDRARADDAQTEIDRLQAQVGELQDALDRTQEHAGQVAELQGELEARDRHIDSLSAEIEGLQHALDRTERRLEQASEAVVDTSDVEAELDRKSRLVEEYERRNRDMKRELEDATLVRDELESHADSLQTALDEASAERDRLADEVDRLRAEAEEAGQTAEQLAERDERISELEAEVAGLKQRLQMERKKGRESGEGDQTAELEARVVALEEELDGLEADNARLTDELAQAREAGGETGGEADGEAGAGGGAMPADVAELRELLERLDRLTDAIERTDLEPLSTVDRIRLQSAVREAEPKDTLARALELLGAEEE